MRRSEADRRLSQQSPRNREGSVPPFYCPTDSEDDEDLLDLHEILADRRPASQLHNDGRGPSEGEHEHEEEGEQEEDDRDESEGKGEGEEGDQEEDNQEEGRSRQRPPLSTLS